MEAFGVEITACVGWFRVSFVVNVVVFVEIDSEVQEIFGFSELDFFDRELDAEFRSFTVKYIYEVVERSS